MEAGYNRNEWNKSDNLCNYLQKFVQLNDQEHASEYLLILAIIIVIFSELLACTKLKSIYLCFISATL